MSALNEADFKPDVIYQVVLDRFFDGDPTNNNPPGDNVFITGNVSELGN